MFTNIAKGILWFFVIVGVLFSLIAGGGTCAQDASFWWIAPVGIIATLLICTAMGVVVELANNVAHIRHFLDGTNNQPVVNAAAQPAQSIGWTCPECGEVNDKYTRFCTKCGKKFSQQSTENANNQSSIWKCPKCGAENDKNALYCKVCGKYK